MTKRRHLAIAAVAGALVLSAAGAARADERTEARRHFRAGLQLIAQHQYDAGIRELEAAYAILPHPNVLYNIARAYNDAGDTEHALQYLRRYLQNDVPDRAEVEAVVERLENRMHQQGAAGAAAAGGGAGGGATATTTTTTTTATTTGAAGAGGAAGTGTGATVVSPALPALPAPTGANAAEQYRQLAQMLYRLADQAQGTQTTVTVEGANNSASAGGTGPGNAARLGSGATANNGAGGGTIPADNAAPASPAAATQGGEAIAAPAAGDEDTYEERVVTASLASQSPLDAPNAIGVITAQDIRLSGLTSVPELLRRVVGMDVMVLDNSDVQVSARGFNQRLSNKMLVLVDGRSVYLDFMGITLWPAIPQSVEDIERIEVIRGPGSALYGADAFTGVINIITRTPGEGRNAITLGGGSGRWLRGAFTTSGRVGDLSYRATASYEQRDTYSRDVPDDDRTYRVTAPDPDTSFRAPRADFDLLYRLGRGAFLRGGLGVSASTVWFNAVGPLRRFWADTLFAQPFAQLQAGGFTLRAFWNHFGATAEPLLNRYGDREQIAHVQQDVVDVGAQYALHFRPLGMDNTVQVGAGYRYKRISWNYLDQDHDLHQLSLYLQDTNRFNRYATAVVSVRGDYDPLLNNPYVVSPRASLIVKPSESQAVRLSGGTAFRTPTFFEAYLDFANTAPIPGVGIGAYGGSVGNRTPLQPEQAISVDVGYLNQASDLLQLEANLFWTRGSNLIQLSEVAFNDLPGTNGSSIPGQTDNRQLNLGGGGFVNDPRATYVYGAEIGARISPVEGVDVFANYTLALTEQEPGARLAGGNGTPPDQRTPVHKFNVGVQLRTRFGFDAEVFAHYVSSQVWLEQVFDINTGIRYQAFNVPDYFILNARVGYRTLGDRLDLGLTGTNLTDTRVGYGHQEHPFGSPLSLRVLATATYRF